MMHLRIMFYTYWTPLHTYIHTFMCAYVFMCIGIYVLTFSLVTSYRLNACINYKM